MRLLWLAFVVAIPLYAYCGEATPRWTRFTFANAGKVYVAMAVLNLYYVFGTWKRLYLPAVNALRIQPDDVRAVGRWMNGEIALISMVQCQALFGLALREDGKTLEQALPFYLAGFLLTLCLWPRRVWSSINMDGR
jgi:hypothetical protein